jgi:hypothetical protein
LTHLVTTVLVYFGRFFKGQPTFLAAFFHGSGYPSISAKNWLGYILGDFFTSPTGRPDCNSLVSSETASHLFLLPSCLKVTANSSNGIATRVTG